MTNYAILVNTTDSFEDCWEPFFKLFSFYWPDYRGKIYLNTESKEFTYSGLDIISIKNGRDKDTWSSCLAHALDEIDTDVILYMQEDYFLQETVKSELISRYAGMVSENDIDCIHFTVHSTPGPFYSSAFDDLWTIGKYAKWRLSCQAALWKKQVLRQYIREYESPWQFEVYGSKRAGFLKHNFLIVNRDMYENTIIDYVFTGIVKGKWRTEVIELFRAHDINIDYKRRGFFSYDDKPTFLQLIKRKFRSAPAVIRSYIEILGLRDA